MKILVGYDGSNAAKDALKLAKKHAKAFDATVEVVTSLPGGDETSAKDVQDVESELEYAKKIFSDDQIPCETHVIIHGQSPGEDLVDFAKENNVDEIFIGVRRRSKVGKIILGSAAQYVVLEAPCPVVTIK